MTGSTYGIQDSIRRVGVAEKRVVCSVHTQTMDKVAEKQKVRQPEGRGHDRHKAVAKRLQEDKREQAERAQR